MILSVRHAFSAECFSSHSKINIIEISSFYLLNILRPETARR